MYILHSWQDNVVVIILRTTQINIGKKTSKTINFITMQNCSMINGIVFSSCDVRTDFVLMIVNKPSLEANIINSLCLK